MSKIEWTDESWNPVRGCARVSPGCENCYAERQARRQDRPGGAYEGLTVMGSKGPKWSGVVRCIPEKLGDPLRWRKPRMVFVNSMSDLFHEDIPNEYIAAVFGVMAACPQHTFQVLTKRPERMLAWFRWVKSVDNGRGDGHVHPATHIVTAYGQRAILYEGTGLHDATGISDRGWPLPNVWLGVSVEDQQRADERISPLLQCPAAIRWVSAEPLLGPIDFEHLQWQGKHEVDVLRGGAWEFGGFPGFTQHSDMKTLDWVVPGGESGPGHRSCDLAWLRSIAHQCEAAGVPCFMKQTGASYRDSDDPFYVENPLAVARPMVSRKGGDSADLSFVGLKIRQFPEASP